MQAKRVLITPNVKPDQELVISLVKAACGWVCVHMTLLFVENINCIPPFALFKSLACLFSNCASTHEVDMNLRYLSNAYKPGSLGSNRQRC